MKAMKPLSQQECIPVGCVPSARYLTGGSLSPPGQRTHMDRGPPPDRDPGRQRPPLDRDLPGQRSPLTETPLETDPPSPPPDRDSNLP